MRDHYGDDYESVAGGGDRLIPNGVRRLTGAAVFIGLIGALGLWSYRLGTRDAAEVPIIRAMEGPARVAPAEPGGLQAAHQGLEVNAVLAGRPAELPPEAAVAAPEAEELAAEDAPQGELVLAAPAAMAERVLGEAAELPVPPAEEQDFAAVAPAEGAPWPVPEDAAPAAAEAPAAADAATGPRPMNRPANLVIARAKTAPVAATRQDAAVVPAVAAAPAREVSGLKKGARLVQLGAFDSEAITRKAWEQLVARHGDLLGAKSLYVERTTANARVFYRLRVAGFASTEETRQMCEALRARGIDCIPVTLQ
jgi:hypothetical protein